MQYFVIASCGSMLRDNRCMYMVHAVFKSDVMNVWGYIGMFLLQRPLLKLVGFFSLGVLKYVVGLYRGCYGCCVFCLYCEACSCRCSCMGGVSVSSCRCCIFVYCVHSVAVLNTMFCMTCSLLMLVEDARGDHMEETFSKADLMTAL